MAPRLTAIRPAAGASPSVIGVNSGAGLAVALVCAAAPSAQQYTPFAAFGGALAGVFLVAGLSRHAGGAIDCRARFWRRLNRYPARSARQYIFVVLQSADPAKAREVLETTLLRNPAWTLCPDGSAVNLIVFDVSCDVRTNFQHPHVILKCIDRKIRAQVEKALGRVDGSHPSVLYIRATASTCKVKNSEDSVLGEMLAAMGCENIADRSGSQAISCSMFSCLVPPRRITSSPSGRSCRLSYNKHFPC